MQQNLVILLHGVGSNGDDLISLGAGWRGILPQTRFESPNAPSPFDMGPGFQWFSVKNVTEENRPQRVMAAREAFDRQISALLARHGLSGQPENVALAGFSQGAIMALDAVASGRWRFAAVVAFSGRLSSPLPLASAGDTPLLLVHGADDPVIPCQETERAAHALQGLGFPTQSVISPRLGHGISSAGAALAGQFIASALTRRDGAV
ncbi:alpha/beta hydrolase [Martelella alba]|uniref:Phospholipase n=1 Tax=Martelella alba TaxID=2590451 RepID=A0ABY2SQP4_9HYPH|nr:prolyl oligopeptidase family serine peptidase [Martelella alba]TKI07675.1 phospholipase [Martelella alba]